MTLVNRETRNENGSPFVLKTIFKIFKKNEINFVEIY